ncbi:MAG: FecR domain-containing protein [Sulfuricella sp.]|nr:FecR domain-containing protein [Sulfuricella sp.]
MKMTTRWFKPICAALLLLGSVLASAVGAAPDICATPEGGIGGTGNTIQSSGIGGTGNPARGTGNPARGSGIGGTGAPAGGIGGTGALAGRVMFIAGYAEAQRSGITRPLVKGDPVCAGDALLTAKDALVQLRMADGGTILLRADSQLTIEAFAYRGVEDGSERSLLALAKGGFRAITGAIGRLHKDAYGIRTPNATVGIRGTDHETYFVPVPPPGQTAPAEPGTYNRVISGATVLQTESGKLTIGPKQIGFAGLRGAPPLLLDTPPAIFGDPTAKTGKGARNGNAEKAEKNGDKNEKSEKHEGSEGTERSEKHEGSDKRDLVSRTDSRETKGLQEKFDSDEHNVSGTNTEVVAPIKVGDDKVELHAGLKEITPAPAASMLIGAYSGGGAATTGSVKAGDPGANLLIGANHDPASASNNASRFNYLAGDAKLIQSGVIDEDGIDAHWGIYAGGVSFDPSGRAIPIAYHHFIFLERGLTPPEVITAMTGTASFSRVDGYSPPTNELGGMGGNVKLDVTVSLGGNAAVTAYNLGVSDAQARNWSGAFSGNVPLGDFAQRGVPLAVTCSGASCGSGSGSGSAVGVLAGPAAKALVTSYGLSTTTGQQVVGTAILSRP